MGVNVIDEKNYNEAFEVICDNFQSIKLFNKTFISYMDYKSKYGQGVFELVKSGAIEVLKKLEAIERRKKQSESSRFKKDYEFNYVGEYMKK
jgi:hypothetical protein